MQTHAEHAETVRMAFAQIRKALILTGYHGKYLTKIFKWLTVAEERNKYRSKTSGFSFFYRLDLRTMGMFYMSYLFYIYY